jgi:hypothetical protein
MTKKIRFELTLILAACCTVCGGAPTPREIVLSAAHKRQFSRSFPKFKSKAHTFMANGFSSNPIKVDTPFSTSYKTAAGALPTNSELNLLEVYWLNPATIGDTFSMTTVDGNMILATGRCEVANQSQLFQMYGKRISDFAVPTLSSGTLYIKYF